MLNKMIMVLTIFIVILIAMSAVGAADNNSSELQSIADNDDITANSNQNVNLIHEDLNATGSFSDLNEEIAKSGGELNLTRNYAYCDNDSDYQIGIVIDKPIIIKGNGFTINGNNQATAFNINVDSVFLRNLSFVNCSGDRGGAIYGINSSNVNLNNCDFNGCSGNAGGAVYFRDCDCFFSDCNFVECSAGIYGGAVYFWDCDCFFSDCNFVECSAENDGGAVIFCESNGSLNNCYFNGCSAYFGGAIFSWCGLYLDNVTFINNSAWRGGAIYGFDELDLNNAAFINNGAWEGGSIYSEGELTMNNATCINNTALEAGGAIFCFSTGGTCKDSIFINNSAVEDGGVIYTRAFLICEGCEFINNVAHEGDVIFNYGNETNIDGCYFESKDSTFALIYGYYSNLFVNNSIFANTSSGYASAIFIYYASLAINNSQFINLKATGSAGAVAVKVSDSVAIENCKFINTSSTKNGGAIFIDFNNNIGASEVYVSNTSFVNVSGDFGGAYVQLGGKLNISDSMFINCTSKYDGGAVYLANVDDCEIDNTTFNSNKVTLYDDYPTFGGAIYVDHVKLNIYGSKFINNSAFTGSGAIGVYDSLYCIVNSTFDNGGEAVHATFKNECSEIINCLGNDTTSDENVFYPQMIANSGINLTLITNEINVENPPIRFDLRDYNWASQVKNQGIKGFCWVFSDMGSLESVSLKLSGLSFDFSENNLNTMLIYSKYGVELYEGGYNLKVIGYLLSWLGPVPEEYDSYDEIGKISPAFFNSDKIHIQDVAFINRNPGIIGDHILKQAILEYGALDCTIAAAPTQGSVYPFYNPKTSAQYTPYYVNSNHAVCVVGWDDAFSCDNFLDTPPGDGAWICKNSWGLDWGDEGYFYVSYYDKTFALCSDIYNCPAVFLAENTVPYNKNYQYDFNGLNDFYMLDENDERYGNPITYANRFVAEEDDLIAGVGTYFNQSGINYTIKIEVNGKTVLTQKGISQYFGYHTIKLDDYISIRRGDEFCVYVTSNMLPASHSPNLYYKANVSITDYWGNWTDLFAKNGFVACIKAYTVEDDSKIINNNNILADYGGSYFSINVVAGDGHAVVGASVDFTINGKTTSVLTDGNGMAKIKINDVPGEYVITTTYKNQTYKNIVDVKLNLRTCKITGNKNIKVDYAGGKYFSVKVVSADGKVVASGASVKFIINGKTHTVKTDKKGIAKIRITNVPGNYFIKTIFNGKTYTNKVTVKQVLKTKKGTVKKTTKKFTLKAKLKINGKLVKGKWVTFKLNGKTYKVKTNSKGIAQKTLKKNVIKKLKKGKTYTVKVTYLKDTIKTTVKVK